MEPNTFAGARLDRAASRRRDAAWLADRLADPASRAIVTTPAGVFLTGDDPGDVPAPQGARGWDPSPGAPLRPALVPLAAARPHAEPAGEQVLLGVLPDGAALFALDAPAIDPAALAPAALGGVRDAAARLSPEDAGLVAYASAMLAWHRRHRFCANCGTRTDVGEAGHVRVCPNCGAHHHPRTDPVVIMLVFDGDDRVLLGRQHGWPEQRYSALAGFVEPGESLEAAVAREVLEEAGVEIEPGPRYASSQPWPFPASLMLGFTAAHAGGEPAALDGELADVRWFTRAEIAAAAAGEAGAALRLPPPLAIARRLLDGWLAGDLGRP